MRIAALTRDILLFTRTKIELYKNNKNEKKMKKGIHPENYRPVVFKDNYWTEYYEMSQNAWKHGVCISMFLFPDIPPG